MIQKQNQMISLMKEILQEDYRHWKVRSYRLEEDLEAGSCMIACQLQEENGTEISVKGEGVGLIDALFNALIGQLASDFPSLKSIVFSEFTVRGLLTSDKYDGAMTRAEAEATVGIHNSEGRQFVFQAQAPSMSFAGILATVQAAEYFVNSERTFLKLYTILTHYRKEGRTDLVEKYTDLMTQVVQNTSYSEVVEKVKSML